MKKIVLGVILGEAIYDLIYGLSIIGIEKAKEYKDIKQLEKSKK